MSTDMPIESLATVLTALQRHPDAVVAGTTAAAMWGALPPDHLSGPVDLVREGGARSTAGVRVRREHLDPEEVVEVSVGEHLRVRVTSTTRTAFDVARRLPTVDAVMVVEALVRLHGLRVDDVWRSADEHRYARDLARLRAALTLVEPGARAGIESPIRIALLLAGVPAPVVGHCVVDDAGILRGVTDLAWPEARCALVCDREPEVVALMTTLPRQDGWSVHVITVAEWDRDPDGVVERAGYLVRGSRRRLGLDRAREWEVLRGMRRPERAPARIRVFG